MSTYAEPARSASNPFVVAVYHVDEDGNMEPDLPSCCVHHAPGGEACDVVLSYYRDRKTGPCFPLAVLYCRVHDRSFTVYPPGYMPYGRSRVAPVGPDGRVVGEAGAPLDWRGTFFVAALDAYAGSAWHRRCAGGTDRWWSTWCRLLARAAELMGVDPEQGLELRHQVAETLAVDTLVLIEGAACIAVAPGYRSRGRAVVGVLSAIPREGVLDRVLRAGHLVGRWGQPFRWEAARGSMRPLAFSHSGTDPPR